MRQLRRPAGPPVGAVPPARTVRYAFTILRSALGDAVREGRLAVNPTDRSTAPSPSEGRPPEIQVWTALEFARFLRWADAQDPDLAMGSRLLAATGTRAISTSIRQVAGKVLNRSTAAHTRGCRHAMRRPEPRPSGAHGEDVTSTR